MQFIYFHLIFVFDSLHMYVRSTCVCANMCLMFFVAIGHEQRTRIRFTLLAFHTLEDNM